MNLYEQLSKPSNLRAAWRALHKNPASQGVDEQTVSEFRDNLEYEIDRISTSLKNKSYKPAKLLGHPLEKGKTNTAEADKKKYRILKIPTVRDRVVQKAIEMLILDHLDKKYKLVRNGVSFAYMKDGGVDRAAFKLRSYYQEGYSWVYISDISKFFDKVDNRILLEKIKAALPDDSLMKLIKQFLEIDIANISQIVERTKMEYTYNPTVGIAQGSPLSPVFANVYLSDFDQAVKKKKYKMVRYADDLVILCKTKEQAVGAHDFVVVELAKLKLKVHDLVVIPDLPEAGHEKHSLVRKYSGILFLGLRFSGNKIYPSGDSFENAIFTVRRAANNRTLTLIQKLISIEARIQGWCASYAFTDELQEPVIKIDKKLEIILERVLKNAGLKTKKSITAMNALGIKSYQARLSKIRADRNKDGEPKAKPA